MEEQKKEKEEEGGEAQEEIDDEGEDAGWKHNGKEIAHALEVQAPWSGRLLDGRKAVETRSYDLPPPLRGQPILLLESPSGGLAAHGLHAGTAVGVVVFKTSREYRTREEWAADAARHCVDSEAEAFGWVEGEGKWGWEVESVRAWGEARRRNVVLKEGQRVLRSLFRLPGPRD